MTGHHGAGRGVLVMVLVLGLAACGRPGPLEPPTGQPAPEGLADIPGDDKQPGRP